jgi:hypothetical protein
MDIGKLAEIISKHGFPIVSAIGLAYFVYYVWSWATTEIKPVLNEAHDSVIGLVDGLRRLDQDILRIHEKIEIVSQFRNKGHRDDTYDAEIKEIEGELSNILEDIAKFHENQIKSHKIK